MIALASKGLQRILIQKDMAKFDMNNELEILWDHDSMILCIQSGSKLFGEIGMQASHNGNILNRSLSQGS